MNAVRHISSIVMALILGSMLHKMIEGIAHRLNPGVALLDRKNIESLVEYTMNMPPISIWIIVIGQFAGILLATFLAGYMAYRMQLKSHKRDALISGILLSLFVSWSLFMIPHPNELKGGALFASLLGIVLGWLLLSRYSQGQEA